jgi:cellulose synthase/poly-beta-1,6-N-acetylglucosamine synthase-like glycosyltransferase
MSLLTIALTVLLCAAALLLLVPSSVLLLQALMAWPLSMKVDERRAERPLRSPSVTVLVPAHNEEVGIVAMLESVIPQLMPGDRVLVVADNCTDRTAAVALATGAQVVVRTDLARRGKGYALDHGVRHLEANAPEVVVIVDADCQLEPGSLRRLANDCVATGRPVQALYLMQVPSPASLKRRVSEFAWRVKNHARPLGFLRLGLPCQLMGTGMAFPWPLIKAAPLASGHLVEDMQLGMDLARIGKPPLFCPAALVTSWFPVHSADATVQRTRWEHGHLSVIATHGPSLLWDAVKTRNASLLAQVLDLCVPPLIALVLLQSAMLLITALFAALTASLLALWLAAIGLACVVLAIGLAWWRFGRSIISAAELLSAPLYIVAKLPIYLKFLRRRQTEWVRTKRDERPK